MSSDRTEQSRWRYGPATMWRRSTTGSASRPTSCRTSAEGRMPVPLRPMVRKWYEEWYAHRIVRIGDDAATAAITASITPTGGRYGKVSQRIAAAVGDCRQAAQGARSPDGRRDLPVYRGAARLQERG